MHRLAVLGGFVLAVAPLACGGADPGPKAAPALVKLGPVAFRGKILGPDEVSGAAAVGDYLVIVSNVVPGVQVLRKDGDGYAVHADVPFGKPAADMDLEAVTADGNVVYVTGSHNRARAPGMKGFGPVEKRPGRGQVFRFTLGPDGKPAGGIAVQSLSAVIDADPVLKPFVPIPNKENGVDIEGLAVKDGRLYFGFRGPVLRENWVPVLSCTFDDPAGTAKLSFVQLGGRGVRDLVAVPDGFLVLGGPVGHGGDTFRLYLWDGQDGLTADVPGKGKAVPLGDITGHGHGRPEGIAVLKQDGKAYELLVVCDGLPGGGPVRWKLTLP